MPVITSCQVLIHLPHRHIEANADTPADPARRLRKLQRADPLTSQVSVIDDPLHLAARAFDCPPAVRGQKSVPNPEAASIANLAQMIDLSRLRPRHFCRRAPLSPATPSRAFVLASSSRSPTSCAWPASSPTPPGPLRDRAVLATAGLDELACVLGWSSWPQPQPE